MLSGDPPSGDEVPFRSEPPLSHESSRIFRPRDARIPPPPHRALAPFAAVPVARHPPCHYSVFLKFRHLISRVREDRIYPLYALRVSSTSSGYPRFLVSSSNGFGEFQTECSGEEICIFDRPVVASASSPRSIARLPLNAALEAAAVIANDEGVV